MDLFCVETGLFYSAKKHFTVQFRWSFFFSGVSKAILDSAGPSVVLECAQIGVFLYFILYFLHDVLFLIIPMTLLLFRALANTTTV